MLSIIKPRGDTKANWESINPVLRTREWGVEWENTVGVGEVKVKIGDGVTPWTVLEYAIINDVTKKVVKSFATVAAENPDLLEGSTMDMLWAVTKKKFDFVTNKLNAISTLIGVFENISIDTGGDIDESVATITDAIKKLNTGKLTVSDIYDGTDSTNTQLALSANRGRELQNAINSLNGKIDNKGTTIPINGCFFKTVITSDKTKVHFTLTSVHTNVLVFGDRNTKPLLLIISGAGYEILAGKEYVAVTISYPNVTITLTSYSRVTMLSNNYALENIYVD